MNTHTNTRTPYPLPHTHTPSLTHTYSHTHFHTHTHSYTLTRTHTHTHAHTDTHGHARTHTHGRGKNLLSKWSGPRRGRYLHNTCKTQATNVHVLSGIRTRDPRNQAATDLHLRLQCHQARQNWHVFLAIISNFSDVPVPVSAQSKANLLSLRLISSVLICLRSYPFSVLMQFFRPYKAFQQCVVWLNSGKGRPQ
jgi:hypothetical protein